LAQINEQYIDYAKMFVIFAVMVKFGVLPCQTLHFNDKYYECWSNRVISGNANCMTQVKKTFYQSNSKGLVLIPF